MEPIPSLPSHASGAAPAPPAPIHIISDLHLAHFASKIHDPRQLSALFDGAQSVIFNGDTSEQHIPPLAERAEELRLSLVESLQKRGIEVLELPGNHDPHINHHTHTELADGKILVIHGDALFRYGSPWGREVPASKEKLKAITAAFGPENKLSANGWLSRANAWARAMEPPETEEFESLRQRLGHYAGLLFPPQRIIQMGTAVLTGELRAINLAEKFFPKAQFIVIGHTHLGRVVKHKNRVAINLGAYVRIGSPRLVIVEENKVRVRRVNQQGDRFLPGKELASWNL